MADLTAYPEEVQEFVGAMRRSHAGREMTERVFRQVAGPGAVPVALLSEIDLASYLLGKGWEFSDVVRRES